MIRDLYWASTGKQPLDSQAAAALAHQWIFYDWIRTALIAVGFVASLLAMSRNADAYSEANPPLDPDASPAALARRPLGAG